MVVCGRGESSADHNLGGIRPQREGGQYIPGYNDFGVSMVSAGSVDGEEPNLKKTHIKMCVQCHVGAGCHMSKKGERTAGSGEWSVTHIHSEKVSAAKRSAGRKALATMKSSCALKKCIVFVGVNTDLSSLMQILRGARRPRRQDHRD